VFHCSIPERLHRTSSPIMFIKKFALRDLIDGLHAVAKGVQAAVDLFTQESDDEAGHPAAAVWER
jgi:hypothetical protein